LTGASATTLLTHPRRLTDAGLVHDGDLERVVDEAPGALKNLRVGRLGHKRSSVLADLASEATVAAVPLLYLAGVLQFWQLVLLVFVLSSVNSQGDTAR
jgi:hypothetical protein